MSELASEVCVLHTPVLQAEIDLPRIYIHKNYQIFGKTYALNTYI